MSAAVKKIGPELNIDPRQEVSWCEKAVSETFSSMLGVTAKLTEIQNVYKPNSASAAEISGVMGFMRNGLEGTMTMSFDQTMIMKVMSKFYDEEFSSIDDKVIGGVGELTNIVFSMLKQEYCEQGVAFQMCLPVVVVGRNHSIIATLSHRKTRLKFETEAGPFSVEMAFLA